MWLLLRIDTLRYHLHSAERRSCECFELTRLDTIPVHSSRCSVTKSGTKRGTKSGTNSGVDNEGNCIPASANEEEEEDEEEEEEEEEDTSCASTSRYVGVSRKWSKWRAQISRDGKAKPLGSFSEEKDAARAYDAAMREMLPPRRHHPPSVGDSRGQLKEVPRAVNFPRSGELQATKRVLRQSEEKSEHNRDAA